MKWTINFGTKSLITDGLQRNGTLRTLELVEYQPGSLLSFPHKEHEKCTNE